MSIFRVLALCVGLGIVKVKWFRFSNFVSMGDMDRKRLADLRRHAGSELSVESWCTAVVVYNSTHHTQQ